jgi:hypothetical protein
MTSCAMDRASNLERLVNARAPLAHARRGETDCGEYCEAAGATEPPSDLGSAVIQRLGPCANDISIYDLPPERKTIVATASNTIRKPMAM